MKDGRWRMEETPTSFLIPPSSPRSSSEIASSIGRGVLLASSSLSRRKTICSSTRLMNSARNRGLTSFGNSVPRGYCRRQPTASQSR